MFVSLGRDFEMTRMLRSTFVMLMDPEESNEVSNIERGGEDGS